MLVECTMQNYASFAENGLLIQDGFEFHGLSNSQQNAWTLPGAPSMNYNNHRMTQDEFITKAQFAVRMKVTTRTVDSWMAKGYMPFRKIRSHRPFFLDGGLRTLADEQHWEFKAALI